MLYLIIFEYCRPLAEVDAQLGAHRDYLHRHFQAGHFLLAGPRQPREGGVILAHGGDPVAVECWLANDPFILSGVATGRIIGWEGGLRAGVIPAALAPDAALAG